MGLSSARPSMSSISAVLKSSVCQTARTPAWLLSRLCDAHFQGRQPFDPCPPDYQVDGLTSEWDDENFVNPPFNALSTWVQKAVEQAAQGKHVVLLMPARVSTNYFHQILWPAAQSVTIWSRPVTFPPFRTPFSVPIVTVELGRSRLEGRALKPVGMESLWSPGLSVESARSWCETRFPGTEFLPLFSEVALKCREIRESDRACVLLMPPWFNSSYFRELLPMVTHVIFIGPRPRWQPGKTSTSLLGSVLVKLQPADGTDGWDGFVGRPSGQSLSH